MSSSYCRKHSKHGGVLIYTKKCWKSYELQSIKQKSKETEWKMTGIEIANTKYVVVVVYRPPGGNFNEFLDVCAEVCESLHRREKNIVICGDINIDYLSNTNQRNDLVNLLASYNLEMTVEGSTRKTETTETCIDWIVTNIPQIRNQDT